MSSGCSPYWTSRRCRLNWANSPNAITNVSVTMTSCSASTWVASRKSMRPLAAMPRPYRAGEHNARKPDIVCRGFDALGVLGPVGPTNRRPCRDVAYHQRMRGAKILITGPTGQIATPIARALAAENEVWGIARFTNLEARESLEKAGIQCQTVNLAAGDFTGLPNDFEYVLNLAVAKSGKWDKDLAANAESVGLLMAHCPDAQAFLQCSSAAVYDPPDDDPRTEATALGDNHKAMFPTYSISKIAGE